MNIFRYRYITFDVLTMLPTIVLCVVVVISCCHSISASGKTQNSKFVAVRMRRFKVTSHYLCLLFMCAIVASVLPTSIGALSQL